MVVVLVLDWVNIITKISRGTSGKVLRGVIASTTTVVGQGKNNTEIIKEIRKHLKKL